MTEEKIPYLQCLKHTGKKVYKYWVATLGIIGVLIGLGLVISSAWKQIVDGFKHITDCVEYIWNGLDSIALVINNCLNAIWIGVCSIPWYWWVGIGIIVGPLILVAIYCVLKHYNIDAIKCLLVAVIIGALIEASFELSTLFALSASSSTNVIDFIGHVFYFILLIALISYVYLYFIRLMYTKDEMVGEVDNNGD